MWIKIRRFLLKIAVERHWILASRWLLFKRGTILVEKNDTKFYSRGFSPPPPSLSRERDEFRKRRATLKDPTMQRDFRISLQHRDSENGRLKWKRRQTFFPPSPILNLNRVAIDHRRFLSSFSFFFFSRCTSGATITPGPSLLSSGRAGARKGRDQ